MKAYVAVVVNAATPLKSVRPEGDHACFVAETKSEAVEIAIRAALRWSGHQHHDGDGKPHIANYSVLVGELTQVASFPIELKELNPVEG